MTDPLIAAAGFLAAQLPWLRHATDAQGAPVAADVFREIGDCAARMRSLVDGPRDQKYLGPCGAPTDWAADGMVVAQYPCEGDVYGVAGAQTGRCRTCKTEYRQDDRRDWLDGQVRGSLLVARASVIADSLNLSVKTIRGWATARYSDSGTLLQEAKLRTYWRTDAGRIVPWGALPDDPFQRVEELRKRGPRLHYVADVKELAEQVEQRRAARRTAEMGA